MTRATVILVFAAAMLAVGLVTILAWFLYTTYLNRVERRLAARKGLYREMVSELATRDRALLGPIIHQMKTLYDLDALEAVLEEQARSATGRADWLVEVYDELGLIDKYIAKLKEARKWRDRAFAAELLGRVGSAKAVPALLEVVQATRTEDSDVREIALRALARIADPRAVEPLVQAMSTADPWLTTRIADILTHHGDAAVDPLIALLTQPAGQPARAWAANVLGELRAARAFPALVRGLNDPDDEVRGKVATALGRLGDRRAVAHLLDHLLTDPAPFVRSRIASTLGRLGGPEVIDRLVRTLRDPAWWVRMRSVEALEQIGAASEGPLLVALDDPDPEIRSRAAVALERLGVPQALAQKIQAGENGTDVASMLTRLSAGGARELLTELITHPSARVREAAMTAVRKGNRDDLTEEVMRAASEDIEPSLRAGALDTLRSLGQRQAVPVAISGLTDADERVRTAAIRLVGEFGALAAIEVLRSRTGDADAEVRAAAARALGALHATAAHQEFVRLLDDPAAQVREAAVSGAGMARLRHLVPRIVGLLRDPDPHVRRTAAEAIGRLGDGEAVPALLEAFREASADLREAITATVARLDPGATPALFDALLQSPEAEGKIGLTRTLRRLRPPGALEILARLSHDSEPSVRAAAIEALGRCTRPEEGERLSRIAVVAEGMNDPDENVRARAIDAGVRLGFDDQARTLIGLLSADPSTRVRERAALALGILHITGGQGSLTDACRRTESPSVRAAAALSSAMFDPTSLVVRMLEMPDEGAAREMLRDRLRTDPWYRLLARRLSRVRAVELRSLAAPETSQSQSLLSHGLKSTLETGDRVQMIGSLRAFQGEQGLTTMLQVLRDDPSPEVRTAALRAVGELLDTEELIALGSRSLSDPSLLVRTAAVDFFSRVPPEQAFPRLIRSIRPDEDPAVLAAVGDLASRELPAFREAVATMPLEPGRAILVVRIARFVHHPEVAEVLERFSQSSWPEVRESVAETGRQRPDALGAETLGRLILDPTISVRHAAAGAAAAAERFDLLEKMTHDPHVAVRRQVGIALGRSAPVAQPGLLILDRLSSDPEMAVRAAAHVARLLQGTPVPLPPGIDPDTAADAVRESADLAGLRETARSTIGEDRRLAAALALALLQDDVAREVARTDPVPAIRHRVSGALELALQTGREARPDG
jgi:HEAT repeat protein